MPSTPPSERGAAKDAPKGSILSGASSSESSPGTGEATPDMKNNMDKDGDGKISDAERREAMKSMGTGGTGETPPPAGSESASSGGTSRSGSDNTKPVKSPSPGGVKKMPKGAPPK